MRSTLIGSVLVACVLLLVFASGEGARVSAQRPAVNALAGERSSAASDSVVSHSVELADGRQQITVIDPRLRAMAVYHVDPRTGAIALKSVRNMNWDLQMDEFNSGGNPSPKDIRALLEQR